MPRPLLERCRPDSIVEFRTSAQLRYEDGLVAAAGGRSLAAIYLWGYSAEMILKAAYFSFLMVKPKEALTMKSHIRPAIDRGNALNIAWPKASGHNVRAWAELLVLDRAVKNAAYPAQFGADVQRNGQRIGQLWNETLRYHQNFAYPHELRQVREAVEWFLVNQQQL